MVDGDGDQDLIKPTNEEARLNGWTSEAMSEYSRETERNIQARHFGGSYGDHELDEHMRKLERAKRMQSEPALSSNPNSW
jgi:hypothetical protein